MPQPCGVIAKAGAYMTGADVLADSIASRLREQPRLQGYKESSSVAVSESSM